MVDMYRLEIPTPFDVGRVNCYAFPGDELTLLDPGPATEAAYEALSVGLNERGDSIADVERVLVTHPHMDHFGLAARVVDESGAHAGAHSDAVEALTNPTDHFDREQTFFRPFLRSVGVPEQTITSALTLPEAYTEYREPLAVDHELADGDSVDVGVDLRVVHTPGHAPGSVCFVSPTDAVAFTGDHVLPHITPNPLLTVTPGAIGERTRSLPAYLDSLYRLREADADTGLGGHGEVISELDDRIQETLDHHHQRKERVADLLGELGPTTAYDVMQEMFPKLPATEVFAGISEVIGHLDLLENEDHIQITESTQVKQYSLR
jgi:glyoxylase-like metal-dependent hydrolase (beta-lactamase superfamily II)